MTRRDLAIVNINLNFFIKYKDYISAVNGLTNI